MHAEYLHCAYLQALPLFSQMQENYVLKSTEGISIWFILIWLGGDAFNLVGGLRQEVLPTMIGLAAYYCFCDMVLIWQWWYYGTYYREGQPIATRDAEQTPFLPRESRSASRRWMPTWDDVMALLPSHHLTLLKYALALSFVLVTAVAAYVAADSHPPSSDPGPGMRWDAQLLGWLSALLYLSSRIPQILKNRHTKCAGLSLALFIFAVGGNVTYVLSILLKDMSVPYLVENMSWIVGSVGTIFLDGIVFYQFVRYAPERAAREAASYP